MRKLAAWAIAVGLGTTPLWGDPLGLPGDPSPAVAFRAAMGLGYTSKDLAGEDRDVLRRLQLVMPRFTLFPIDPLEIGATLLGLADTRRPRYNFVGVFGLGGQGFVRFYPLLQGELSYLSMALEGGYIYRDNEGVRREEGETLDDRLIERTFYATFQLGYRGDIWSVYGGALWEYTTVTQKTVAGETHTLFPFGVFFGVDFYVNPLIFFSLEMHNFHEDALWLGVGADLTP